jgi:pimeloyl-ACP methyl ester carboxylesterase/lysophospholipase L1-like esterase
MNRTYSLVTICLLINTVCLAEGPVVSAEDAGSAALATVVSDWHGYQKQSFTLAGHPAIVFSPKNAAPGNPWVWRTSFPDFHSEVDQELVYNGYHIGFINVVAMLGSDSALDIMDQFYDQARLKWGLAEKPALEPCSRGGLHAYRYAARHPQRIACILGDVPVMDLKSWPLGWAGAKQQVKDAMNFYGFESEAELKAFRGNPIDLLGPIAKAKIPIRHAICLNDRVVPPEQNTMEAQRRLKKLGHDMELVVVQESVRANGHHFTMPKVFESARFVMRHACVMPGDIEYFNLRNGLANCLATFRTKQSGRIAFLGGSITYNRGWRDELIRYFKRRFPETNFEFIAAGIPSVGSNGHAFRLERDILKNGPVDLLFVEAAVNDGSNIPEHPEIMRRAMEGVVRHIRIINPMTDIVHMHFAMGKHLKNYDAGKVPVPIAEHEKVAAHYGCTTLNITKEVADRIKAGEFTWKSGFRSNVHPPPYGQRVYANSMTRMLDAAFATSARPEPHAIPESLVDARSYVDGRFGKLEDAVLGKGFSLDPKWKPSRGGTRAGFVNVPALVASEPGSEFSYAFDGAAIGLFLAAGYDSCILQFSIDGGKFQKIDTLTRWSKGLHLPWPLILADGLKPGKHKITVQTTGDAQDRTALHVIHILEG